MAATPKLTVIDKATHAQAVITGHEVTLSGRQFIVELNLPHAQIKTLARQGSDLVITTADGQTIVVHGYFVGAQNALVVQDDGGLWSTDLSHLAAQTSDGSIDAATASNLFAPVGSMGALLDPSAVAAGAGAPPVWLPLALAGVGIAASASGGGSDSSTPPVSNGSSSGSSTSPVTVNPPVVGNIAQNTNGTLTVSGTAHTNNTVTWPDSSTATSTVDANGHYAATSAVAQTAGAVSVIDIDTDTDANGHSSQPATQTWTAPTPPQVDTVTVNDGGTVTVSGTAEAGSTITVTFADGSTASATAGADGGYSITGGTSETSGAVSVTETDSSGNTSAATATATAPTLGSGSSDTGSGSDQAPGTGSGSTGTGSNTPTPPSAPMVNSVVINKDGTVTVTGMAIANDTITATFPDGSSATATVDSSGHYSVTSAGTEGYGTVAVTQSDPSGHTSGTTTYHYSDPLPPPAPEGAVLGSTAFGMAEPGSTITVTFPDGSTATGTAGENGVFSFAAPSVFPPGTSVSITATDAAGHTSQPDVVTMSYFMGALPPPNPDGTYTLASGTTAPGSTVTLILPDGSTDTAIAGTDGSYSIISDTPAGGPWVIVTTGGSSVLPPSIDHVASNHDGSLTITGESVPGDTITATFPDGSSATATVDSAGHYSLTSMAAQPAGTIAVIDTDQAHNISSATVVDTASAPVEAVIVTAIAPDTGASSTDFVTSQGHLSVSGASSPLVTGESIQVNLGDGQGWHTAAVSGSAQWSFDNTASTLPDGLYVIQAHVVDALGNPLGHLTVQEVEVSASGALNLSLADVLSDASTLTSAGSTQQITINNGGIVNTVHLAEGVGSGSGQWQEIGATTTLNGVHYDVYHNAAQGTSAVADLLIQHGISVI